MLARNLVARYSLEMLASYLTTLLFATSAVCATRSAQQLGATRANFFRLSIAAVLLAAWAHIFGKGLYGSAFQWFLFSGFIGFGLADLFLFHAYKRIGSRLTILLVQSLMAPFAGIMEWLWLGTTLTLPQILSGGIVLVGVCMALMPGRESSTSSSTRWFGILFGILGGIGQAVGAVISRKAFEVASLDAIKIDGGTSAYQRILGGMVVAILSYLIASRLRSKETGTPVPSDAGIWVFANALVGPTLGVACYQTALRDHPAGIVLPIVATAPLFVLVFSRWTEKEKLKPLTLVGFILAVAGAIILARVSH